MEAETELVVKKCRKFRLRTIGVGLRVEFYNNRARVHPTEVHTVNRLAINAGAGFTASLRWDGEAWVSEWYFSGVRDESGFLRDTFDAYVMKTIGAGGKEDRVLTDVYGKNILTDFRKE